MKINFIITTILVLFAAFGSIRFLEDNDFIQDKIILHANFNNRQNTEAIDNLRVKYLVLGTDGNEIIGTSSATRVSDDDVIQKTISRDANSLEKGEYWVRIYAYGDDGERHIKHRPIIVR